jgi:DNA-directed RNA polymerase specialized sigma24 family protein
MTTDPHPPTMTTPRGVAGGAVFLTTRWTLVRRAKADSDDGRRALRDLCDAYYEPVAAFLRVGLRDAEAARDLTHGFFESVLGGGTFARAEQDRGRFRSYLLGAAKHFLSHHRESMRCEKRGGGARDLSLDDDDAGEARSVPEAGVLSPDQAFDRQWALTVLARALDVLRSECDAEGRPELFQSIKPWLTGDAVHGDQAPAAAACGMNANAFKVAVHRMRKRFRQLVKDEVSGTLDDPCQVDDEMRSLFAALGGS